MLTENAVNWLVMGPSALGLVWAMKELSYLRSIKLVGPGSSGLTEPLKRKDYLQAAEDGTDVSKALRMMREISEHIAEGATTFLICEYKYMLVYVLVFSILMGPLINYGTMFAFIVGALTSIACGFIGMKTAVFANVRTAHESWKNLSSGFDVALRGGSVMGFCLVSFGVLTLFALIVMFSLPTMFGDDKKELFEALAGYGLGGSSIALFGRVGGGIYTKAADVGADLSGKNEYGMDEDDPRNPACIADNVGDNVGDVAGMGADLFGSFAEATCAAMVIAGSSSAVTGISTSWSAMLFPLLLSSTGIVVGVVTMVIIGAFYQVKELADIEKCLKAVLVVSTVLQTPVTIYLAYNTLPSSFDLDEVTLAVTPFHCVTCVMLGLWSGLLIGFVTEYYTSHSYTPVREIAQTQKVSAATGIIYGLALGYMSCIVPVVLIGLTVCVAHQVAGMYGVALGALGMLGTLTMGLAIDAYGPISDNAGGIAEMSELGPEVRRRTDALDAAGNTTAAIGKGFAIGSAALVSLALFGAYTVRAKVRIYVLFF